MVAAIVAKKQEVDSAVVSHGWWDRFRQRHPHLTMRAGESFGYRRAMTASPDTFWNYFDQLENILNTNGLRHAPSRIFNADEIGIPLQHRPGRRIAVRGQKHVIVSTSGNKTQITVLVCVNARGSYIPLMIVFKRKGISEDLIQGEVPNIMYGLQNPGGWMASSFHSGSTITSEVRPTQQTDSPNGRWTSLALQAASDQGSCSIWGDSVLLTLLMLPSHLMSLLSVHSKSIGITVVTTSCQECS